MARKYRPLDAFDKMILRLIDLGGDRCQYIASCLKISEPAVTQRIIFLSDLGFVDSVDTKDKFSKRRYVLTEDGQTLVNGSDIFMDMLRLKLNDFE